MKNYFYGINKTANTSLHSDLENRNILSFNNTQLQRNMCLSAIGKQSGQAQRTYTFNAKYS